MQKGKSEVITIEPIQEGQAEFYILGQTPLVYNKMGHLNQIGLLLPTGRKTAAQKAANLKHNPPEEYRASAYARMEGEEGPTKLLLPMRMFKAACAGAALRIPGSQKTEIQQLLRFTVDSVDLYGVPQLYMAIVRQAGQTRAPDIRTRAIVPNWACKITLNYITPYLSHHTVGTLLASAGMLNGVGDDRPQKGGNFGQFALVNPDNPQFQAIVETGGRKAQETALEHPFPFDEMSNRLLTYFEEEIAKRRDAATPVVRKKAA